MYKKPIKEKAYNSMLRFAETFTLKHKTAEPSTQGTAARETIQPLAQKGYKALLL